MRVLLAETDCHLGAIVKQALENNRYIVDLVDDGEKAWNYLKNKEIQYTIVILGWNLSGLSSIKLIEKIRNRDRNVPILLIGVGNSLTNIFWFNN